VFANVIDTYHEPIVAPVEFEADIEARTGRYRVPGIIDGHSEPIRNPVTGDPHRARVILPQGFEYHEAESASARGTTEKSPIALDYADSHAHFARLNWTPAGPVHV
jgi:hypothetical protein